MLLLELILHSLRRWSYPLVPKGPFSKARDYRLAASQTHRLAWYFAGPLFGDLHTSRVPVGRGHLRLE